MEGCGGVGQQGVLEEGKRRTQAPGQVDEYMDGTPALLPCFC